MASDRRERVKAFAPDAPVATTLMARLSKVALSALLWIADTMTGLARSLVGRLGPPRCVVLYYHAVNADERGRFAAQMDMLRRAASPVPANGEGARTPGGRYVAVTFDDGFASVLDHARPELESRGIPWTFFIPTGSWGQRPRWVHDSRARAYTQTVLTKDQLQCLLETPSVTIGAHSVTHPDFETLSDAQVRRELAQSKSELEQLLRREVTMFSFPFGRHTARAVEQARDAGYRRVFTVSPTWAFEAADEFVTGRMAVEPGDWWIEYWLKLRGAYRWQAAVSDWKRRWRDAGGGDGARQFHRADGLR